MKRVFTAADNVLAASADQNNVQDRVISLLAAAGGTNALSGMTQGMDGLLWQPTSTVAANSLVIVDNTQDWHDRELFGVIVQNGTSSQRIGGSGDYLFNVGLAQYFFCGYTGKGALNNVSTGAPVSNTGPAGPVRGTGAGGTSWVVDCSTTATTTGAYATGSGSIALYTDPTTKYLYFWNNTTAAIQPTIVLLATGVTGLRP